MDQVFLKLVNMSISASWLVLAVVVLRLVLKRAPRWVVCALWGLVAVRLVCPVSFESVLSLIPSGETVPQEIVYAQMPTIDSGVGVIDRVVNPMVTASFAPANVGDSVNPVQVWLFVAEWIWIIGMGLMAVYALVSWALIRRRVSASVGLRENVWLCDYIDSPFILGIVKPRIYLPSGMVDGPGVVHVLAHERAHLKRKDHWWKPLGFGLLTVYWFNPVMWAAYVLLCRDIELACDERVIRELGEGEKKKYSEALLECSVPRRMIAACPLAFGEVGVKARIKSVLNYKKPAFWVMVVAVVACVAVGVCFLTDPVEEPEQPETYPAETTQPSLKKMTLEDVRRLAEKVDGLTWADFEGYEGEDLGHGLYVFEYVIDETFVLRVGAGSLEGAPMYAKLSVGEEWIDIRSGDVEEFIQTHQTPDNSVGTGVGHGNANVYLRIPEGWEYETVAEDFMAEFGIAFWPEGVSEGRVKLVFREEPLGVCGTGLEEETVNFSNGLVGSMGTYDSNPYWSHIVFTNTPGCYVALTEGVESWWGEYEGQVMEILGSAELGTGIVRMEEAIAAAQEVTGETGGYWSAWYDTPFAIWRVDHSASEEASAPQRTILVDSKGYAVSPDEWGILLTATNVSPVGLTLNCIQSGGTATGELMTGQHYWLERWSGTEWETMEAKEGTAWTMEALMLPKNDTTSWNLNWQWLYGTLPEGTYRIGKNISEYRGAGLNEELRTYYADFEVSVTPAELIDAVMEAASEAEAVIDPETGAVVDVDIVFQACPDEYEKLVSQMGEDTLWYCFGQMLREEPTDARGYVMTALCRDVMENRGEAVDEEWFSRNGPDWFREYLRYALKLHETVSPAQMMEEHYAAWVLYYLTTQLR